MAIKNLGIGCIGRQCRLVRDALDRTPARDTPGIFAMCKPPEPATLVAKPGLHFLPARALHVPEGPDAAFLKPLLLDPADSPYESDRLVCQEVHRFLPADYRETTRFFEIGRDLCQELVVGESDRTGDSDLILHPPCQPYQHQCRWRSVHPQRSRQVQKRLVEREGFDCRCQFLHH